MQPNKLDKIADRQVEQTLRQTAFGLFMLLLVALLVVSFGAVQRTATPAPLPVPGVSLADEIAADTAALCGDGELIVVHAADEEPLC